MIIIKVSVINFVAHHKQIELRDAASLLKAQFISKKSESKSKGGLPILILEYDNYLANDLSNPKWP